MTFTAEESRALLYKLQNDPYNTFNLDYFNEKNPNPYEWKAVLEGTIDSIYEGGYYMIKIVFNENYPNQRPRVYFLNRIFHPHVNQSDWMLDTYPLLKENDIISLLECIDNIFFNYDYNIEHAYHQEPLILYRQNLNSFIGKAKEWVKNYAKLEDLNKFYN